MVTRYVWVVCFAQYEHCPARYVPHKRGFHMCLYPYHGIESLEFLAAHLGLVHDGPSGNSNAGGTA